MTYREICVILAKAGVETPEWDAKLLLERCCGQGRGMPLTDPDRDYPSEELRRAVERRAAREPLQYIFGEWDFYRQTYRVSGDCLIPRSDTELLVEEAIRRLPAEAYFADLCTGSGCIAISVLAERKDTTALAADLSDGALKLARENAVKNGVPDRLTFWQTDLLNVAKEDFSEKKRPDAILSNPPYIARGELEKLAPEVGFEPRMALDGGEDGLIFYRKLFEIADFWLSPGGFCLWEIGYDQGNALKEMACAAGYSCEIRKDLGGCDRLAVLHRKN